MQSLTPSMKRKEGTKQTAMARLQQHQEATTATWDEQFQKEYHSLMTYSDEMHARQEFEFACQKRHLITELNEHQQVCSQQIANNDMLEGTIQSLRDAHNQSLRIRQNKVST